MNQETIDLVVNYLDKISEKLGVGIDYLWPIFIRQQIIFGILSIIAFVLTTATFIFLSMYSAKHYKPNDDNKYSIYKSDHEDIWIFALIISGVSTLGCFIMLIKFFPCILNPEYYAFMDLIGGIK